MPVSSIAVCLRRGNPQMDEMAGHVAEQRMIWAGLECAPVSGSLAAYEAPNGSRPVRPTTGSVRTCLPAVERSSPHWAAAARCVPSCPALPLADGWLAPTAPA